MNQRDLLILRFSGKKFRKALQAGVSEHEALAAQAEKKLQKIYKQVDNGKISADEFKGKFQRQLVNAYESAFAAGKGDENLSAKDRRWINSYAAQQFDYLEGFAKDIADGAEPIDPEARVGLYAGTVKGVYWQGALSEYDGPVDWILATGVNNCDDCVELADNSPYEPEDLPTTPGAGDTACLGNCYCTLVSIQ